MKKIPRAGAEGLLIPMLVKIFESKIQFFMENFVTGIINFFRKFFVIIFGRKILVSKIFGGFGYLDF